MLLLKRKRYLGSSLIKTCAYIHIMCVICLSASVANAQALRVFVKSEQNECVIKEPVKFAVSLVNQSEEILNVMEIEYLDMNMDYIHLEIMTPRNELELRRFKYYDDDKEISPQYPGEALYPGDSISCFIYPNTSYAIRDTDYGEILGDFRVTFDEEGTYKIRAIYNVPRYYGRLYKGPDGRIYSNQITVAFREPTDEEREILDAYWARGGWWVSLGDNRSFGEIVYPIAVSAFTSIIATYPALHAARLAPAEAICKSI